MVGEGVCRVSVNEGWPFWTRSGGNRVDTRCVTIGRSAADVLYEFGEKLALYGWALTQVDDTRDFRRSFVFVLLFILNTHPRIHATPQMIVGCMQNTPPSTSEDNLFYCFNLRWMAI